MTFDSIAEGAAAPAIAALGGSPCQSFSPLLSDTYEDAAGVELRGKPDSLIRRGSNFIFIDTKSGVLNQHHTQAESTNGLKAAYRTIMNRHGDHLTHSQLSTALYSHNFRGQAAARSAAFNHSLFKLLALQSKHGWRHFLVVFNTNPASRDAKRYCAAGLVWCTLKTLPQLLLRIELEAEGVPISFVHRAQQFSYEVVFDNGTATAAEVRSHFLATVADDRAATAAKLAQDDIDWEAGIRPY